MIVVIIRDDNPPNFFVRIRILTKICHKQSGLIRGFFDFLRSVDSSNILKDHMFDQQKRFRKEHNKIILYWGLCLPHF